MATKTTDPPGPRAWTPLGAFRAFRNDRSNFLLRLAHTYGDIAHFRIGPLRFYLFNHPDLIRDVLVTHHRNFIKGRGLQVARRLVGTGLLTSEGDLHLRQRRLTQPAFHRQRVMAYGDVMVEHAARLSDRWRAGTTVDIHREMLRLTLAIAGKTLFDADVEAEADEIGRALTTAMASFNRMLSPFAGLLERLPLRANRDFLEAKARLDATIYRIIHERRARAEDRGDLLSMLLLAQDDEGDGSRMTDEQVRDEALTLFLAGHETTANALTWTWYLLAQHPAVAAQLGAELDGTLAGRLPSVADIPRLAYTRRVLTEAMRLYPPAYLLGRIALDDYAAGGYVVPAGASILMSQYVMHRDPRYFPDPLRFAPDRWTPEFAEALPRFAYFPFGGGPRVCIGEGFAWTEGILVLAVLAQRWQMQWLPGQPLAMEPVVTLRPKHPMLMRLARRDGAASAA